MVEIMNVFDKVVEIAKEAGKQEGSSMNLACVLAAQVATNSNVLTEDELITYAQGTQAKGWLDGFTKTHVKQFAHYVEASKKKKGDNLAAIEDNKRMRQGILITMSRILTMAAYIYVNEKEGRHFTLTKKNILTYINDEGEQVALTQKKVMTYARAMFKPHKVTPTHDKETGTAANAFESVAKELARKDSITDFTPERVDDINTILENIISLIGADEVIKLAKAFKAEGTKAA